MVNPENIYNGYKVSKVPWGTVSGNASDAEWGRGRARVPWGSNGSVLLWDTFPRMMPMKLSFKVALLGTKTYSKIALLGTAPPGHKQESIGHLFCVYQ